MKRRDPGFAIRDSFAATALVRACVVLLLCIAGAAHAADIAATVQARIEQHPVLRGEFAQTKAIVGFRAPLRSRGVFLVARDHGVVWDTLEPFPSTLVLGRERIRTGSDGELEEIRFTGNAEQGMRELNAMLIALLGGELAAVRRRFDADGALIDDTRWTLALTPRDPQVARAVQTIELRGAQHVEHVVLVDPAGNRTEIAFTAQRSTPTELTAAEAARFD